MLSSESPVHSYNVRHSTSLQWRIVAFTGCGVRCSVLVIEDLLYLFSYMLLDGSSLVFVGGIVGVSGSWSLYTLCMSRGEGRKSLPQWVLPSVYTSQKRTLGKQYWFNIALTWLSIQCWLTYSHVHWRNVDSYVVLGYWFNGHVQILTWQCLKQIIDTMWKWLCHI